MDWLSLLTRNKMSVEGLTGQQRILIPSAWNGDVPYRTSLTARSKQAHRLARINRGKKMLTCLGVGETGQFNDQGWPVRGSTAVRNQ